MATHHGRARGNGKRIHQITHYGIMGGLAPQRNASVSTLRGFREGHAKLQQKIPADPVKGLAYMMGQNPMGRNMLSRNPVGSGGVGNMIPNIPCCSAGTLVNLPKKDAITEKITKMVHVDPVEEMVASLPLEGQELWNKMDPDMKSEWSLAIREVNSSDFTLFSETISIRKTYGERDHIVLNFIYKPTGSKVTPTCENIKDPTGTNSWWGRGEKEYFYFGAYQTFQQTWNLSLDPEDSSGKRLYSRKSFNFCNPLALYGLHMYADELLGTNTKFYLLLILPHRTKWDCDRGTGKCVPTKEGKYNSLSKCEKAGCLKAGWYCTDTGCMYNGEGPLTSDECKEQCVHCGDKAWTNPGKDCESKNNCAFPPQIRIKYNDAYIDLQAYGVNTCEDSLCICKGEKCTTFWNPPASEECQFSEGGCTDFNTPPNISCAWCYSGDNQVNYSDRSGLLQLEWGSWGWDLPPPIEKEYDPSTAQYSWTLFARGDWPRRRWIADTHPLPVNSNGGCSNNQDTEKHLNTSCPYKNIIDQLTQSSWRIIPKQWTTQGKIDFNDENILNLSPDANKTPDSTTAVYQLDITTPKCDNSLE